MNEEKWMLNWCSIFNLKISMFITRVYLMLCVGCFAMTVMAGALGKCKSNSACDKDYCCAFRFTHNAGFCMPSRGLGDMCSISFMKGKSFTCGCKEGLTCAIVDKDKITGQAKTRCVEIPTEAKELHENSKQNVTQVVTKLLTARELRKLLHMLQEQPKARKVRR